MHCVWWRSLFSWPPSSSMPSVVLHAEGRFRQVSAATGLRRGTLRIVVKASTRTHQHRRDALHGRRFHVLQSPDKDRTGPGASPPDSDQ
jgi:hypothetical protein